MCLEPMQPMSIYYTSKNYRHLSAAAFELLSSLSVSFSLRLRRERCRDRDAQRATTYYPTNTEYSCTNFVSPNFLTCKALSPDRDSQGRKNHVVTAKYPIKNNKGDNAKYALPVRKLQPHSDHAL